MYDVGEQGGTDYLVMECVPGESLADAVGSGSLSEKDAANLGAQIASALEEAHEQGIVHRDLKPGNIMVTPKGQVKVLDFGLARMLRPAGEASATESFTQTQNMAGTLPYMSPEQLRGEPADARTDIHALGAVLFEMATRRRLFQENSVPQLTDAILHQQPVAPRALNARVSPELERIILKCLEKERENRYQSAKEAGVDVRRLSSSPGDYGGCPDPAPSATSPLAASRCGALAVVLALAIAFVANVVGIRQRLFGAGPATQIRSIAVLPLENLSHDPEQEYFADGITDELITDLAQIGALRVISRTSVMRYRNTTKPMPRIARELNVDGVVEGTVERIGNRVRVEAELIDGPNDKHIWAKSYERDATDILMMQEDLARAIADEIQVNLTPQEQTRLASARPVNPDAYNAVLKASYLLDNSGRRRMLEKPSTTRSKPFRSTRATPGLTPASLTRTCPSRRWVVPWPMQKSPRPRQRWKRPKVWTKPSARLTRCGLEC